MGTLEVGSYPRVEPELNLLSPSGVLEQSLARSLYQNVKDFLFPEKLPPLLLASKPLAVGNILDACNYRKRGLLASGILHTLALVMLVTLTIVGRRAAHHTGKPHATVSLVAPDDVYPLSVSSKRAGGGGGGDRDVLQAPRGRLPKFAMQQLTPPMVVLRNDHPKLIAEPTVVAPPEVHLAMNNLPNLGDPVSHVLGPPSNGTGFGGGLGSGSGGGVGSGEGPGVGAGRGGGIGGGVFRVGGGVSAPRPVFAPDPEYSEEARTAKYQGTCVLWLIVGTDGRTRDIRVARTLGLGLDQKAEEAVQRWVFEPALRDGQPVAVQVNVEVTFHLY